MSDDTISRQAAIDALIAQANHEGAYGYIDAKEAEDVLMALPTVGVPERKVGEWIDNNGLYQCSVCKHIWSELWWTSMCPIDRMNKMMRFCPNCGARMKGEDDG